MHAVNRFEEGKVWIEAGYSEVHLISKALTMYRLWLQTAYGWNSEEEMLIEVLRDIIMNPTVERVLKCKEGYDE